MNRGAQSIIATFEDEPYRAHFSGNVTELCPVGALLPATYRFRARPWEIDNTPTVCGLCPVGCNVWATTREGKVDADPLPEPPRGGRRLALRQGPLHVRPPARARPAARAAPPRPAARLRPGDVRGRGARGGRRAPAGRRGRSSSPSRAARASSRPPRSPGSSARASAATPLSSRTTSTPRSTRTARRSRPSATPRSASSSATSRSSSGRRVVDLWLRAARRDGAEVVTVNPTGTIPVAAGQRALRLRRPPAGRPARRAPRPGDDSFATPVASRSSGRETTHDRGRRAAALAASLGLGEGSGVYVLPRTPNGRGVAAAWRDAGEGRGDEPRAEGEIGALIVSGDEAAYDPRVAELAERARFVLVDRACSRATTRSGRTSSSRARATSSATGRP